MASYVEMYCIEWLTRIVPGGIGQNLGAPRGNPLCSDVALGRNTSIGARQQIAVPIKAMAVQKNSLRHCHLHRYAFTSV